MAQTHTWKKTCSDAMLVYDFIPASPENLKNAKSASRMQMVEIESLKSKPLEQVGAGWLRLFSQLPTGLQQIIRIEITHGNIVVSIGQTGWPHPKSIVVQLENRFQPASRQLVQATNWRLLNDPHYCREEISEFVSQTAHLIIV